MLSTATKHLWSRPLPPSHPHTFTASHLHTLTFLSQDKRLADLHLHEGRIAAATATNRLTGHDESDAPEQLTQTNGHTHATAIASAQIASSNLRAAQIASSEAERLALAHANERLQSQIAQLHRACA